MKLCKRQVIDTHVEDHSHDHHHGPATGADDAGYSPPITKTSGRCICGSAFLMLSDWRHAGVGNPCRVVPAGTAIRCSPSFFNQMTTNHGLIMVFGAIMPAFVGLANWLIPMMVGAPDMALPRMNNLSFWILPFAFGLLASRRCLWKRGGTELRLDLLRAAVHHLCPRDGDLLYFRRAHVLGLPLPSWAASTSSPPS